MKIDAEIFSFINFGNPLYIPSKKKNQVETFTSIKDKLVDMGDRWLLHKFELAAKDVNKYKKHIVRAIHQDRAKTDTMKNLSPRVALILFDYAMKFLPQKYREEKSDFFAKKGLDGSTQLILVNFI